MLPPYPTIIRASQGDAMTNTTRILLAISLVSLTVGVPQAFAQKVETEGYVDAGGDVRLFYRLLGTGGDPVILIHGGRA